MALYIPAGRRRRRTITLVVAAVVVGLAAGWLAGRASSPSVADQVASVRTDAREIAAGLRVIALHDQTGTAPASGDAGADLVLKRTRTELERLFRRAPWLTRTQRDRLLRDLDALQARTDRATTAFGTAAEAFAVEVEETFGVGG